jgi:PAS domain S-box-containing protein
MNPEIWRYIFDVIKYPLFLHDAQFRLLLVNNAYCREAGLTEAQVLGKPYWEVFPLGSAPLPDCKDAMCGKDHTGSQEELSVGEKTFFSKSYVIRDAQSKPLYAMHLFSDITERKQAEDSLNILAAKYHTVFELSTDAIMLLNEKGFFDCNEAALQMFG